MMINKLISSLKKPGCVFRHPGTKNRSSPERTTNGQMRLKQLILLSVDYCREVDRIAGRDHLQSARFLLVSVQPELSSLRLFWRRSPLTSSRLKNRTIQRSGFSFEFLLSSNTCSPRQSSSVLRKATKCSGIAFTIQSVNG